MVCQFGGFSACLYSLCQCGCWVITVYRIHTRRLLHSAAQRAHMNNCTVRTLGQQGESASLEQFSFSIMSLKMNGLLLLYMIFRPLLTVECTAAHRAPSNFIGNKSMVHMQNSFYTKYAIMESFYPAPQTVRWSQQNLRLTTDHRAQQGIIFANPRISNNSSLGFHYVYNRESRPEKTSQNADDKSSLMLLQQSIGKTFLCELLY